MQKLRLVSLIVILALAQLAVETVGAEFGVKPKENAHLFILSGQSNMVRLDPAVSFTPAVTKAFGINSVIVVKDAENGQPISRWVKDWKSVQGQPAKVRGDLYERMMGQVKAAIAGRDIETVTLVWMQGERDAAGNQVAVYKASLEGLLNQLRRDLNRNDIHFVLGRLSDYSLDSGKHPEWQMMRDLQVAYAESSPLGAWVDTDDLNNKIDPKTGKPRNDVHYTRDGYRIFGQRLAEKAIELISSGSFSGEKTDFRGFDRYTVSTGRGAISVVRPKKAAPGKPWLWRSIFWGMESGAIEPFTAGDLELLEQGWHVVKAPGDVSGHPRGNAAIDAAYDLLTQEYGFSKTVSMASMSRETLALFRWASANPEKVESIYVDNGVCNVKSWPAGKLVPGSGSKASGNAGSWTLLKKTYGFSSDEEALAARVSPIDLLEPLAKAGVPILMGCGTQDTAVPYEENGAIMKDRYEKLGGSIQIIFEEKGHHPHGLKGPTPVVDFIKQYNGAEPLIPADKQLDPAWVQSLTERGHALDTGISGSKKDDTLKYIGMPVGGIGCGQLYLSGDGQLWLWDIFKSNYTRESVKGLSLSIMTMGGHYSEPVESEGGVYTDRNGADVNQGFVLQITAADGRVETRPLNRHGFSSVNFQGEYPIGRISYEDDQSPVSVELEAFSPFIPLNAKDSAIPATVMTFTAENRSKEPVQLSLQGYLQNAVNPYDKDPRLGTRMNMLVHQDGVATLLCKSLLGETVPEGQSGLDKRHGWGSMALSLIGTPAGLRGSTDVELPLGAGAFDHGFKNSASTTKALDQKLVGSLGQQFSLAPGARQTVSFLVSWYFPLHQERGGFLKKMAEGSSVNRHYKPWFTDAADVARYVGRDFERLAGGTRLWNKTWYDSTLPVWLLDRAIVPVNTLATQTFHWFDNGRPWGWEGVESCVGTCTHVWSYAQAMARLFPELERRLREMTDYGVAFNETTGVIGYRGDHSQKIAIDGQAGTIIRTWREHSLSPDNKFLERVWPQTKKAIEFLMTQDPDQDGVLEGSQAHTLDANWSGPMGWLSSVYCASLRAGEQMALVMGDQEFSARCGAIADRGYEAIVEKVYNGEYFIHLPPNTEQINTGKGSHIDQVLGQSWALQTGLPRVLPKEETVSALNALWKYNVTPDAGGYAIKHTAIKGHRVYAAQGEAGLLMTTWPRGGAETAVPGMAERIEDFKTWLGPGGYFDECMTGFEYQVAAHMIYEGEPGSELVERGLAVARHVHDRYAPEKRNPFNEIECGDHYVRAMAGYGVFLATCGFEYNGPKSEVAFDPRISPENFRTPFTAAEGWGTFSQTDGKNEMKAELGVNWGSLSLKTLRLNPRDLQVKQVEVMLNGKKLNTTLVKNKNSVSVEFATPVSIAAGQTLKVLIGNKR